MSVGWVCLRRSRSLSLRPSLVSVECRRLSLECRRSERDRESRLPESACEPHHLTQRRRMVQTSKHAQSPEEMLWLQRRMSSWHGVSAPVVSKRRSLSTCGEGKSREGGCVTVLPQHKVVSRRNRLVGLRLGFQVWSRVDQSRNRSNPIMVSPRRFSCFVPICKVILQSIGPYSSKLEASSIGTRFQAS